MSFNAARFAIVRLEDQGLITRAMMAAAIDFVDAVESTTIAEAPECLLCDGRVMFQWGGWVPVRLALLRDLSLVICYVYDNKRIPVDRVAALELLRDFARKRVGADESSRGRNDDARMR